MLAPSGTPATSYTVQYTPPASAGACAQPGSVTISITLPQNLALLAPPTVCPGTSLSLATLLPSGAPGGVWTASTPAVFTAPNTFTAPASGAAASYTFTYTPSTGCFQPSQVTVPVGSGTPVQLTAPPPVCANNLPYNLTQLEPTGQTGGTWSGTAVTGNMLAPSGTPATSYTVQYTPPASAGACAQPGSVTISITLPSNISLRTPADICLGQSLDLATLLPAGAPGGGIWSVQPSVGLSGNVFSIPTNGGVGLYTLTYTPPAAACANAGLTSVRVTALQPVVFQSPPPVCVGDPFDLSSLFSGTPPAGSWTGNGVAAGTSIYTATANGTATLTFIPAAGQCLASSTVSVTASAAGQIALQPQSVCADSGPFDLRTLLPAGAPAGVFAGIQVSGNNLNTNGLAPGPTSITYTPTGACYQASSVDVTILSGGAPTLSNRSGLCVTQTSFDLRTLQDPAYPNGVWSGGPAGAVAGNIFNPSTAGAGTFTLTFTPSGGCLSAATATVEVLPEGAPAIAAQTLCAAATPFDLRSIEDARFAGGTWSGSARVTGTQLDISTPGNFSLVYTPAAGACAAATSVSFSITSARTLAPRDSSVCLAGSPIVLSGLADPSAAGGTWTLNGQALTVFDPAGRAVGPYLLTYSIAGSCFAPGTATIRVNSSLPVQLNGAGVCIARTSLDLRSLIRFSSSNQTGTWTGPGVTGTTFVPATAGVGQHQVTYLPKRRLCYPKQCNHSGQS